MKVKEIREFTAEELQSRINETRKQIVELRFQQSLRKLENSAKLPQSRKVLARLLTIQSEKSRDT